MGPSLPQFLAHFRITGVGWYWIAWIFGGFGVMEGWGLLFNAQDTLSWQIWGLEQINFSDPMNFADWTPVHWVLGLMILAFVVWLGVHLIFGVWRLGRF